MREIKAYTVWLTIMAIILVALCMMGGYFERGYIAFDGAFIILILSPIIITYWYKSEKEKYYYRKSMKK